MTDDLRPIDYAGHVPCDPREDVASDSREAHERPLNPPADPELWRAWMQGYLACASVIAANSQARIDAILERERPAA